MKYHEKLSFIITKLSVCYINFWLYNKFNKYKKRKIQIFLVVTAREGLVGEGLSVLNSKKGWKDGLKSLADFLIGNFDKKLTFITQYQSL